MQDDNPQGRFPGSAGRIPGLPKEYLWSTRCAKNANKACVAYAVDAGEMSPGSKLEAIRDANRTELITTRTQGAADLLRRLGVKAPMRVTADTALAFEPGKSVCDPSKDPWWEPQEEIVGMATRPGEAEPPSATIEFFVRRFWTGRGTQEGPIII